LNAPRGAAGPHVYRIGPLAVWALWTLYGAMFVSQAVLNRPPGARAPWKPYGPFVYWLAYAWLWAAFTPLIARLVRRVRPVFARPQSLLLHLVAVLLIQLVITVTDVYTFYFVNPQLPSNLLSGYTRGIAQSVLLYSTVVLAVLALDHARLAKAREVQAAQLESDLARARLETLRRQLQPHFLFNTLNTISELIETDPPRAGAMVTRLGDLLRRSLEESGQPLIPLSAELEFVRLYTEIEQERFESWLSVEHDVDAAAFPAQVPPMILQPLVENAIKHGIAPSGKQGVITIRAHLTEAKRLQLEVRDNGVGVRPNGNGGWGIGLGATRERLIHIFGAAARFQVDSRAGIGTRVIIEVPFVKQPFQNV
jgi:sensor histidine kinase YesM